jgi:hypothetical protein
MQNVDYSGCNNGSGQTTFPQATVYDSMVLHNKSISFYINYTEVTESEEKTPLLFCFLLSIIKARTGPFA